MSTTTAGRAPTIAPTQPSTRRITDIRAARYMTTRADNRVLVIESRASVRGHDRSASWRTGEDQRLTGVTPIGRCSTPRVSTTPPQRRSSRETSAPCERGNINGHSIIRVLVLASPGSAFATLAVVIRVNRPNLRPLAPALQETADAAEGLVGAGGCARL